MLDRYNRRIDYLRISVTDRCNLRCSYCIPPEGIDYKQQSSLLSFEEIANVVQVGVELGITKIRLTGGEPLVRPGIIRLIKMIKNINEVEDIALTTNGILLAGLAENLKIAGLNRVNISLDTINSDKFIEITSSDRLTQVIEGIDAAISADLRPIKINFVRIPGKNEEDEEAVRRFCRTMGLELRFIRQMNLQTGEFYSVEGGNGGVCSICNRLRMTADGLIIPCLHSNLGYSVKELGVKEAFLHALESKPLEGKGASKHQFYNIGG